MPFLCVLSKTTDERTGDRGVDLLRLAQLLCPYRGDLQRVEVPRGYLYLSSIAGTRGTSVCAIPNGTRKTPQTAWLEVSADGESIRFETDPLGTFPLWIFEDETHLVVTSEVKSLMALRGVVVELKADLFGNRKRTPNFSPYRNVRRVMPGATLRIGRDLSVVEAGGGALTYVPRSMFATREESQAALGAALVASAEAIGTGSGGWGTFLSGGIDSSMATALVKKAHRDLRTYTLGTEFGDEYADAENFSSYLGTAHSRVSSTKEQAREHFERAVFCNETIDGLTAETVAQLSILARAASTSVRTIVTGYGADLLFGSMLRHELYMQVTGVDDLQSLIERTCWSGEFAPFFAWSLGIEVHHLFWAPSLMNTAFRIPSDFNFDGTSEKIVMRTLAVEDGHMERAHAFRKKQALTDGTQFNRLLSSALQIPDNYAYEQKSEKALSFLKRQFSSDRTNRDARSWT